MSPKTAYLKQTSEQRCREAFLKWWANGLPYNAEVAEEFHPAIEAGWNACWKYLEERLLKEIQS